MVSAWVQGGQSAHCGSVGEGGPNGAACSRPSRANGVRAQCQSAGPAVLSGCLCLNAAVRCACCKEASTPCSAGHSTAPLPTTHTFDSTQSLLAPARPPSLLWAAAVPGSCLCLAFLARRFSRRFGPCAAWTAAARRPSPRQPWRTLLTLWTSSAPLSAARRRRRWPRWQTRPTACQVRAAAAPSKATAHLSALPAAHAAWRTLPAHAGVLDCDFYGTGHGLNEFEGRVARMLGKEAGLCVLAWQHSAWRA